MRYFILCFYITNCLGQIRSESLSNKSDSAYLIVTTAPPASYMLHRVSYLRDFADRFNFKTSHTDNLLDSLAKSKITRKQHIDSLFNLEDPQLNRGKRVWKEMFLDNVMTTSFQINNIDSVLFAVIKVNAILNLKDEVFYIYLRKFRNEKVWDWKIVNVDVPFLKAQKSVKKKNEKQVFVSSQPRLHSYTHETNFLDLQGEIIRGVPLVSFALPTCQNDKDVIELSQLIQSKALQVVEFTTAMFIECSNNWVLQLDYLDRESDNSGWLITDVSNYNMDGCLPVSLIQFLKNRRALKQ